MNVSPQLTALKHYSRLASAGIAGLYAGGTAFALVIQHRTHVALGPVAGLEAFRVHLRYSPVMLPLNALVLAGGLCSWLLCRDRHYAMGAAVSAAIGLHTGLLMEPVYNAIRDKRLDSHPQREREAMRIMHRWGRLHAVRVLLSLITFALYLKGIK